MSTTATVATEPKATVSMSVAFARQVAAALAEMDPTKHAHTSLTITFRHDREEPAAVNVYVYPGDSRDLRIALYRKAFSFSVAPLAKQHVYPDGNVWLTGVSEFGVPFYAIVEADLVDAVLAGETK